MVILKTPNRCRSVFIEVLQLKREMPPRLGWALLELLSKGHSLSSLEEAVWDADDVMLFFWGNTGRKGSPRQAGSRECSAQWRDGVSVY